MKNGHDCTRNIAGHWMHLVRVLIDTLGLGAGGSNDLLSLSRSLSLCLSLPLPFSLSLSLPFSSLSHTTSPLLFLYLSPLSFSIFLSPANLGRMPDSFQAIPPLSNNYFPEMCSGSEAGSYVRLIDFGITQR